MYSTVIFPSIDRIEANPAPCRASPKSIFYLDIQAILISEAERPKIGVVDMLTPENFCADERAEEIAPYVSFYGKHLRKGQALEELYDAMRNSPALISSSAFLTSNISPSEIAVRCNDPVILGVSPAFSIDPWQATCLLVSLSSYGQMSFTAISRKHRKGLSIEKLSCDKRDSEDKQKVQYILGDICFSSRWQITSGNHETHSSWQDQVSVMCDQKKQCKKIQNLSIPMLASSQQRGIMYIVNVVPVEEMKTSKKIQKKWRSSESVQDNVTSHIHTDFIVLCSKKIDFSCTAVIQSIQASNFPEQQTKENYSFTFFLGLSSGEADELVFHEDSYQLRMLNRSPEEVTNTSSFFSRKKPIQEKVSLSPVIAIFDMDCYEIHNLRVMCIIHASFLEWVIIFEPQNDSLSEETDGKRLVLRQNIDDESAGYLIGSFVSMAALSDMGKTVTLLTSTKVCKVSPPFIENVPETSLDDCNGTKEATLFRVSKTLAFRVIPQSPITSLRHEWHSQVFQGLVPRYSFVEKIDQHILSKAQNAQSCAKNKNVLNSLYHTLGKADDMAVALYKHTSSAFPVAIFSSPSHSRVFYLHFTCRSTKFECEEKDGITRISMNEVGTIDLKVPYCVVEYCDHLKVASDTSSTNDSSLDYADMNSIGEDGKTDNLRPYHDTQDHERVAFWTQRFQSEWLRKLSPQKFKDLSPWSVIDIKVWERECFPLINVKIGENDIKCISVIRQENTLHIHRSISYETLIAAEASADIISRIRMDLDRWVRLTSNFTDREKEQDDAYENIVFMKSLTVEDEQRVCPYCEAAIWRVYNVFYPKIITEGEQCLLKADVYYSTVTRCDRGHLLRQCEASGEIMADWKVSKGRSDKEEYHVCGTCSSVFSRSALEHHPVNLCAYCSLPLI